MSVVAGPDTIRDGLTVLLDATNPDSYPGSGVTWADLAGNYDGTFSQEPALTNGLPTLSTSAGMRIDTTYKTNGGDYTLEAWAYPTSLNSAGSNALVLFGEVNVTGDSYGTWLQYQNQAFTFGHFRQVASGHEPVSASSYPINTWHHVTAVRINATSHTLYINGVEKATGPCSDVTATSTYTTRIGDDNYSINRSFDGVIAVAKIYNRALIQAEIEQNFHAMRGRFGL